MKNKIRSQIKDLANEILSKDTSFETVSIKNKVAKLYEQLTVLEYLESHIEGAKQQQAVDSKSYREGNWFQEPEPVPQSQYSDELAEPLMEKIKDLVAQMPNESEKVDELLNEILPKKEVHKSELEDFAASYQEMPVFERKDNNDNNTEIVLEKEVEETIDKPKSLNEKLNKGLQIGLNDRLAFIKHLFDESPDDYTRVLSQINSMSSFNEANQFINETVKPDYNNWLNKEDYMERFMSIIEKSFN
ncbi:MAG: hypothetical protein KUG68_09560 [Flavobacteriaceae bacterium]|nr:hypothetical protein [Flavobacteriaceae bacterium]